MATCDLIDQLNSANVGSPLFINNFGKNDREANVEVPSCYSSNSWLNDVFTFRLEKVKLNVEPRFRSGYSWGQVMDWVEEIKLLII